MILDRRVVLDVVIRDLAFKIHGIVGDDVEQIPRNSRRRVVRTHDCQTGGLNHQRI